jgi:outer membrane protein OmpA-like peptidoglycan-associated protein
LAHGLRNTITALILLAGIVWSLPIGPGRTDAEPVPASYSVADPAEFRITLYRGTLAVTGHSRSRRHEERIIGAIATHHPPGKTDFDFHPLGVAPSWWDSATVALTTLLVSMQSADAHLTEDSLHIRALVTDRPAAENQLQALRKKMPSFMDIDVQLTEIDTSVSATRFCERQFATFRPGPVAFEESGTEMRVSAYPALDQVVALADACRAATVTITGHTDSSGNEDWNRQLSLARAEAVAAHLISRGIATERLLVDGAGSSLPIADNATRYGRSINRRIDIQFTGTSD